MSKDKASTSEQRLVELQEGTLAAPKDSELCLTLGEAFLRVSRVDEAAASYQRAVELDPRSDLKALYWEWLGLVREMEGRLEEALEAYFQWLDADPVATSPLDRLGTLLVVLGRWTDLSLLQPQFERRIELSGHPRSKESLALYTFVTEAFVQTDAQRAKEVTLSALEADPDSPSMRFLLGLITYQEGSLELSRGEFERVLELDQDGLWQEPRFALDWNGWKARVMVAKLARQQGDTETALQILTQADDFDRSDSEGLIEMAELLVENQRYDDLINLMKLVTPGPSRLNRLLAESLLGKGRLAEAHSIFETEASLFVPECTASVTTDESADLTGQVQALWSKAVAGVALSDELAELREDASGFVQSDPVAASLFLLHRYQSGAWDDGSALEREINELCRTHSQSVEVWETAAKLYGEIGLQQQAQLSRLVGSKLRHGSRPGPTGAYTTRAASGARVLVGVVTEFGPLVVKIEADVGRSSQDQLFGWGRDFLMPGLELAKSVLEGLAQSRSAQREICPELSFIPRSFRVMITPVAVPTESVSDRLLSDGELGSIPLGFLVALLSVLKAPPSPKILVMGRLGLRGQIDGVPELEETLLAVHQTGAEWDQLLLAEAGGFRLVRASAWLWHGRSVTLVKSAAEVTAWQSTGPRSEVASL